MPNVQKRKRRVNHAGSTGDGSLSERQRRGCHPPRCIPRRCRLTQPAKKKARASSTGGRHTVGRSYYAERLYHDFRSKSNPRQQATIRTWSSRGMVRRAWVARATATAGPQRPAHDPRAARVAIRIERPGHNPPLVATHAIAIRSRRQSILLLEYRYS